MNNALNKTCAAPRGTACGPLVRLARRGMAACVMACLAFSVQAQQYGDRGRNDEPQRYQQPRQERNESLRGDARQFDREAYEARMEQRRQMQLQQQNMHNSEAARRGGRMTPDERRDLRRQINEAGMDLYPNSRRR